MKRKRTYTLRKPYFRRTKRRHTRGKGLPYVYNKKVYLRKKTQKGSGAASKILSSLIPIVGHHVSELMPILMQYKKKKL